VPRALRALGHGSFSLPGRLERTAGGELRSADARHWPPPLINSQSIKIVREVDPETGCLVTKYGNKSTGLEVGLRPTIHAQKANAGFIPPPS
jgi:hypothetical protein